MLKTYVPSLIVKTMGELVADDGANATIVHVARSLSAEERGLKDLHQYMYVVACIRAASV